MIEIDPFMMVLIVGGILGVGIIILILYAILKLAGG